MGSLWIKSQLILAISLEFNDVCVEETERLTSISSSCKFGELLKRHRAAEFSAKSSKFMRMER